MSEDRTKYGGKRMPRPPLLLDRLPGDGERMTTFEYLFSPETLRVQELHHGVVRVAESPTPRHQRVVLKLATVLRAQIEPAGLGEIFIAPLDVILDQVRDLVVQPDLFFVSHAREHIVTDRVWGAPDLVVEVLSPKPRLGSLETRLRWFADYGVRECWLVHQIARQIEVLRFDAGNEVTRRVYGARDRVVSELMPDLDLRPRDLISVAFGS